MTIAEIVAESRRAQGVPPTVEDGAALARLARLLQTRTPARQSGKTEGGAGVKGYPDGSTIGP